MAYALIQAGVVIQKQCDPAEGFIEVPDWVVCGMIQQGDTFVAPPVPKERVIERKIAETKAEASRRILSRYSDWKQRNMLARVHELRAIETGGYRDATGTLQPARALATDEVAELAAIISAWGWIKQVRAVSDQIEADIQAAADPSTIDVASDPRWPA